MANPWPPRAQNFPCVVTPVPTHESKPRMREIAPHYWLCRSRSYEGAPYAGYGHTQAEAYRNWQYRAGLR